MEEFVVVQQLMNLYCFDMSRYRYMSPDGRYHTMKIPYDEANVFEHLDGKNTLCVYARERSTIFQCFDIDESDPAKVHILIDRLSECGIPRDRIYVSYSGNKGYHVEIFFDRPVWKSDVENFFNCISRDLAIKMECKPGRNGAIKLPLGVNFKTGRRCWFADPNTENLDLIEDMDYIFNIQKISADDFAQIVYICNKERKTADIELAKTKAKLHIKKKNTALRNEPTITAPGQRHDKMLKKAVWLRSVGGDADNIYEELINWVNRQDPNLIGSSWHEIEEDAARIASDVVKHYDPKAMSFQRKTYPKNPQTIDANDIQIVLNAPTKTARKAAFLICASVKVFGACSIGYDRIAQILGVTTQTAFNAIKALIDGGVIEKRKTGGIVYSDGEPRLLANEYVLRNAQPVYKTITVKKESTFSLREICASFDDNYYRILSEMCDKKTLAKYLSKSEIKENV